MKRWATYALVFWAGLWLGAIYGAAAMDSFNNKFADPEQERDDMWREWLAGGCKPSEVPPSV